MSPLLVIVSALVASGFTASLPSYIKLCKRNDPKLSECAVESGREAIPKLLKGDKKLGIPVLEPFIVEEVTIGDRKGSKNSQAVGLTLVLRQLEVSGLRRLHLEDNCRINLKRQHIQLRAKIPSLQLRGKYSIDGRILLLPIQGKGDMNVSLGEVTLAYNTDFVLKPGAGEKEYLQLTNPKLDFQAAHLTIYLDNLFNGDKRLGDHMNKFLNENSNDVLEEFRPAISDSINQIVILLVNSVAKKVPYDNIFPK